MIFLKAVLDGGERVKSVLISIRPEWCEKIASGQKTIEVRKTRPKIDTPFKCYIYCTTKELLARSHDTDAIYRGGSLKRRDDQVLCGHVIGEFISDRIVKAECGQYCRLLSTLYTQILPHELFNYANYKPVYGWHISNLVIYDKPKELSQFVKPSAKSMEELLDYEILCNYCDETGRGEYAFSSSPNGPIMCEGRFCKKAYQRYLDDEGFTLYRPPQSWCYVEEVNE